MRLNTDQATAMIGRARIHSSMEYRPNETVLSITDPNLHGDVRPDS
jgi:hypothetical protein